MTKRMLSKNMQFKVYEFLKTVGKKGDEDFWIYQDGWSDDKVAAHFLCSPSSVATIRSTMGRLRGPRGVRAPGLAAKVGELSSRVEELTRKIDSLEGFAMRHGWHIPVRRKEEA